MIAGRKTGVRSGALGRGDPPQSRRDSARTRRRFVGVVTYSAGTSFIGPVTTTSPDSSLGGTPAPPGRLIVKQWLIRAGPPAIWALTVQYFVADSSIERRTASVSTAPSITCLTVMSV